MIITRSPLRISLGGGGTDLPSYYQGHGGFLIAGALDRAVYVAMSSSADGRLRLRLPELEEVDSPQELKHAHLRAALRVLKMDLRGVELWSFADAPPRTGLGSSGSFTTALLYALHALQGRQLDAIDLAEQACSIEMGHLNAPVGKQDPYVATHGGLRAYTFARDGKVLVESLNIAKEVRGELDRNLLLFFTGIRRSSADVLADQDKRTRALDPEMMDNLHATKQIGMESRRALERGDLEAYGALLHRHWENKRHRSRGMSNDRIDTAYQAARKAGALGGKLVGAGGGGYLLFYCPDPKQVRACMRAQGLTEMSFSFSDEGTSCIRKDRDLGRR
jgi:D-glycero-alpha-D-manno-heptose-7-phosphate kinase